MALDFGTIIFDLGDAAEPDKFEHDLFDSVLELVLEHDIFWIYVSMHVARFMYGTDGH